MNRIAREESIPSERLKHQIRSARGGSKVIPQFKQFIKDTMKLPPSDVDFLVVAIDGNCKGHKEQIKKLEKYIKPDHPLKNKVAYAVPDPHIERWYLMDQRAFKNGLGVDKAPSLPAYKCKKAHYKQLLNQALIDSNISSLLGGAEYAERIVANIQNFEILSHQNSGFQYFIEDLRRLLRMSKRGRVNKKQ
ncbi:MAG: hypothetical protein ACE5HI_02770 [bacterium]